jgi:hypothetical protein
VFLTSFLFALMHGVPAMLFVYTLMGAYLHFVFLATRSIWVPVLLHALNNGAAVVVALSPALSAGGERYEADAGGLKLFIDLAAAGLLVCGSVALWTGRSEPPHAGPGRAPEYPGVSAPPGEPDTLRPRPATRAAAALTLALFGTLAYLLARV